MIGILNILSFILICFTIIILTYKLFRVSFRDTSIIFIIISFVLLLLVTLTNILEHLNITSYFDLFEDELDIIFIPLFIFAVFSYCLKRELLINNENQQRLKESNIRLNMAIEGANEALWEWHPDFNYIVINKEYCFLNFNPATNIIDNTNWTEVIHPDSNLAYENLIRALKNKVSLPDNSEILMRTTDGDFRWVLIRGEECDLNIGDHYITYLGTIYDIGKLKEVQGEIVEALKKAEESENLKASFLNNISHEIRTPMNAIYGFTDLMNLPNTPPEKRNDYLRIIIESCRRLIQVVEDIIELSRIMVGAEKIMPQRVDINSLFMTVIQTYYEKASSKGLNLTSKVQGFAFFTSDERKLIRILGNLTDNAIKFSEKGSVEIAFRMDNQEAIFSVSDTGIGIDKIHYDAIFMNFRQIDNSSTRFYGGSGLGLSICKGLINLLNGRIWIDSTPGRGTTVYFAVPLNKSR